jgi:hypothetical protein
MQVEACSSVLNLLAACALHPSVSYELSALCACTVAYD